MSYQRNQHPTLRALFDLKLTYQTGLCSLHLDLSSGTVRATWSPSPIVRRSQRRSWRGTAGGNCTKTQNAKAHQERYLYPAKSLSEFRRTVGSRQPPIILAIRSDCWHKTNWTTAHLNHVLSDSSEIGAELRQHGVGYRPDVLVELEPKIQKSKWYYSWQPGQREQSQEIWSEGKGTLLSLGDQSWFPLDRLTRSPKLNSTGRAAPLTLIQLTLCSINTVQFTLVALSTLSRNPWWGATLYTGMFKVTGGATVIPCWKLMASTQQLLSFPFPTIKSTLLSLHQVWNHKDHNSIWISR